MGERRLRLYQHQREIVDTQARHVAVYGGVGSGKTFVLQYKMFKKLCKYPGSHGIQMRKTQRRIKATIWKDMLDQFGQYISEQNLSDMVQTMHNGSAISYMHSWDQEQGVKHLDGANCSFFLQSQSEDIPEKSWHKMLERSRRKEYDGGVIPDEEFMFAVDGNPRSKSHWVWKVFAVGAKLRVETERVQGEDIEYKVYEKMSWVIIGKDGHALYYNQDKAIAEAKFPYIDGADRMEQRVDHMLVVIPTANFKFLRGDYRETASQGRGKRDAGRYLDGMFDSYTGAIYDNFNRDIHLVKPFSIRKDLDRSKWVRILGIDWGLRDINPTCCLWCVYDRDNDVYYYYREYYAGSLSASNQAAKIVELNKGDPVDFCFCDPSMWNRLGVTAAGDKNLENPVSIASQMQDVFDEGSGIVMMRGNNASSGRELVRKQLDSNNGIAGLHIFDNLEQLTTEVEGYQFLEPYEDKMPRQDTQIEAVKKKDDHGPDVIKYITAGKHMYDKSADLIEDRAYYR